MEELAPLVTAAQAGDLDAFGALVGRTQRMAYAVAYALVGDAHRAEDVAQEAFIEAYLCLGQLREPAAFPGWLRKIVFKQGDRVTRRREHSTLPLDAAGALSSGRGDPAATTETRELRTVINEAIARLPEHERLATVLFYLTGYSLQEIADVLELPVGTVKKRLHSSRRRLRERMEAMAAEHFLGAPRPDERRFPRTVQLLIAVRTGAVEQVRQLLAQDPTLVEAREQLDESLARNQYVPLAGGYTPLHGAAARDDVALIDVLLAHGADLNARSNFGETPLHAAIRSNLLAAARRLLAHGADPNLPAENGMGPLHWAATRGHLEILRALLEHGARPDAVDRGGRTARDWAALKQHHACVNLIDDFISS